MENKRVDFTTAKLAKEKGFDFYDTGGYYHINEGYSSGYAFCYSDVNEQTENCLLCPDQSLLQKWLREKHQLFICVKPKITGTIDEPIVEFTYNGNDGEWNSNYYSTYEQALEIALVEYLQRVSETVA
jgi:hypothetical protein